MNLKRCRPEDLAIDLLGRSICAVQVSAVLADRSIYSWGWNGVHTGLGIHAEAHCLSRANRRRISQSTLYTAARRKKSGNVVTAKPCADCQALLRRVKRVVYRDGDGSWQKL